MFAFRGRSARARANCLCPALGLCDSLCDRLTTFQDCEVLYSPEPFLRPAISGPTPAQCNVLRVLWGMPTERADRLINSTGVSRFQWVFCVLFALSVCQGSPARSPPGRPCTSPNLGERRT